MKQLIFRNLFIFVFNILFNLLTENKLIIIIICLRHIYNITYICMYVHNYIETQANQNAYVHTYKNNNKK